MPNNCGIALENVLSNAVQSPIIVVVRSAKFFFSKNDSGSFLSFSASTILRFALSLYGAVKVREDGGVETLQVEINAENYKGILELLKKSLIENARGYDAKDDRLSGNPNQMNIQSMYSDIDLDANGMETEFQAAFEELLWFINQDFSNRGLGDYEGAELQIVFNRDILINETESIENCSKSVGILSTETIVEQHPWVTDVEVELARLRKEKDEAMEQAQEYAGAFQTGNQNKGDNGEGE